VLGVTTYINYDEEHYPGAPEGFLLKDQAEGIHIYTNPNALPLGFAYDCYTNLWRTPAKPNTLGSIMAQAVILRATEMDSMQDILQPLRDRKPLPWRDALKERALQSCYDICATPGGLSAKIDLDSEKLVFFSIQFDKGWTASVNGFASEIYEVNLGMMALRVPAGQANEIVLSYRPRGLREGVWASLSGTLTLAGYCVLCKRREKRKCMAG
jgi:hypothetical protein